MPKAANFETLSKFGTLNNGDIARAKFQHLIGRYRVSFIGFGVNGQSSVLTSEMSKFATPKGSHEEKSVEYVNGTIYYPGKWTWNTIEFTVFNSYDNKCYQALQNQLQRQRDTTEVTYGDAPSNYKFKTIFEHTDGHQKTLSYWVIEGCWLMKADPSDAENGNFDVSTINCSMRYDNASLFDREGNLIRTTSSEVVDDPTDAYLY